MDCYHIHSVLAAEGTFGVRVHDGRNEEAGHRRFPLVFHWNPLHQETLLLVPTLKHVAQSRSNHELRCLRFLRMLEHEQNNQHQWSSSVVLNIDPGRTHSYSPVLAELLHPPEVLPRLRQSHVSQHHQEQVHRAGNRDERFAEESAERREKQQTDATVHCRRSQCQGYLWNGHRPPRRGNTARKELLGTHR